MSAELDVLRVRSITGDGAVPALVVVDVQRSFGDPEFLGAYGLDAEALASVQAAVARIGFLVDEARRLGVPVVWVELVTQPSRPWHASQWLRTGDPDAAYGPEEPCVEGTPGVEWFGVAPAEGEIRVAKRGYSGFLDTGLAPLLREAGVTWLAVTGLTTECCVMATATDAAQLDWPVVVPSDAVAAYDLDLNSNALDQLALNVGMISTADDLVGMWQTIGAPQ